MCDARVAACACLARVGCGFGRCPTRAAPRTARAPRGPGRTARDTATIGLISDLPQRAQRRNTKEKREEIRKKRDERTRRREKREKGSAKRRPSYK